MEVFSAARFLLAHALGCDPGGSELEVASVNCKHAKSSGQGDLFFSRRTANRVRERLLEMGDSRGLLLTGKTLGCLSEPFRGVLGRAGTVQRAFNPMKLVVGVLWSNVEYFHYKHGDENFELLLSLDKKELQFARFFEKISANPQGQLCMRLNRPMVFSICLAQVAETGSKYGHSVSSDAAVLLINDSVVLRHIAARNGSGQSLSELDSNDLGLSDSRAVLLVGVLSNLLKARGHKVNHHHGNWSSAQSPDDPVRQFLQPYLCDHTPSEPPDIPQTKFLSSLLSLATDCNQRVLRGAKVDAEGFLKSNNRLGKGGYDRNIKEIPLSAADGSLLDASWLAREANRYATTGHVTCHVAPPSKAFLVQQAMVLEEIHGRRAAVVHEGSIQTPCILLSGEVELCPHGRDHQGEGVARGAREKGHKGVKLGDILRWRKRQMTAVYCIKYGKERAEGKLLQDVAGRMADAVVKFELLSSDMQAKVKVQLPDLDFLHWDSGDKGSGHKEESGHEKDSGHKEDSGQGSGQEARFPGAFVLYNYARMATILSRHKHLVDKGTYPSLPAVETVDFLLLKDEVEWQLLFQYVVRFPAIVQEAAHLRRKGVAGVLAEVSVKKVCLFLMSLSHLFSSYYSRVKILMSPEPHLLLLIHARLHLIASLKQVMFNALALLGIQPLEEL